MSLTAFLLGLKTDNTDTASTMCFGVLSFSQLFHTFNMRSEKPFFKRKIPKNIPLLLSILLCMAMQAAIMVIPKAAGLFGVASLNIYQWITVALLSFAPIPVCEIFKILKNKK